MGFQYRCSSTPNMYTPENKNQTMEQLPSEDVSPIQNGDFPA